MNELIGSVIKQWLFRNQLSTLCKPCTGYFVVSDWKDGGIRIFNYEMVLKLSYLKGKWESV